MTLILSLTLLSILTNPLRTAITSQPFAVDVSVEHMQKSIFIENRHLFPRKISKCSSIDGPYCHFRPLNLSTIGAGVIPDYFIETDSFYKLLNHSGRNTTSKPHLPGFSELYVQVPREIWYSNISLETSSPDTLLTHGGTLALRNVNLGFRVSKHFSLGLPEGVIANWEGRWLVGDLPDYTLIASQSNPDGQLISPTITATATLSSFLPGYLRFSKRVVINKLWIQLPHFDADILVAARLGTRTVWTSQIIDSSLYGSLEFSDNIIDITLFGSDGHSPLTSIDEIVFWSTKQGLSIVSIDMVDCSLTNLQKDYDELDSEDSMEEKDLLLLTPRANYLTPEMAFKYSSIRIANVVDYLVPASREHERLIIEQLTKAPIPEVSLTRTVRGISSGLTSLRSAIQDNMQLSFDKIPTFDHYTHAEVLAGQFAGIYLRGEVSSPEIEMALAEAFFNYFADADMFPKELRRKIIREMYEIRKAIYDSSGHDLSNVGDFLKAKKKQSLTDIFVSGLLHWRFV